LNQNHRITTSVLVPGLPPKFQHMAAHAGQTKETI
jgi:hypothetical protein